MDRNHNPDQRQQTQLLNLRQVDSFMKKVYILLEACSSRFEFKFHARDLIAATWKLVQYELSVQSGRPKPELLAAARFLISTALARFGATWVDLNEKPETVNYHVELQLTDRLVRKLIPVPQGVDCKRYVDAREAGNQAYVSCTVLRVVKDGEWEAAKKATPTF